VWCGARCGKLQLISSGWLSERQCFRDAWMQVTILLSNKPTRHNYCSRYVNEGDIKNRKSNPWLAHNPEVA
jgi:hypothetical protein